MWECGGCAKRREVLKKWWEKVTGQRQPQQEQPKAESPPQPQPELTQVNIQGASPEMEAEVRKALKKLSRKQPTPFS